MHFRFWPVIGLLALGLFVALGQGQEPAAPSLRRVEIQLSTPGARDKVATELGRLGFLPERNGNGESLRGRVPQAQLPKVAALEGVERVFCGPVVAGPEKQLVNSYNVTLRCRLDSNRNARVVQWRDLVKRLEKVGFKKEKGWDGEEFYGDVMKGTMPASGLGQLRRERQVVSTLLVPEGQQLKTDGPVMVRFELTPDLGAPMQAEVAEKTKRLLQPLGW